MHDVWVMLLSIYHIKGDTHCTPPTSLPQSLSFNHASSSTLQLPYPFLLRATPSAGETAASCELCCCLFSFIFTWILSKILLPASYAGYPRPFRKGRLPLEQEQAVKGKLWRSIESHSFGEEGHFQALQTCETVHWMEVSGPAEGSQRKEDQLLR